MGFFKTVLMGSHVSGINLFGEEEIIQATIEEDNIVFKLVADKKKTAKLSINKINNVRIFTEKEIIEKDKSVVGRAVAGTLIAGPLGTIVGGISGVGSKKKKKNFRIMTINYGEDKNIVILEDKWAANFDKFSKEINKLIYTENEITL
jgi:uncharacterized membrane protein